MPSLALTSCEKEIASGASSYPELQSQITGSVLGRKVGSVKTLEQKKEQYKDIISYLKRGYSIRTIATLTGKVISTVQRIKKDFNL